MLAEWAEDPVTELSISHWTGNFGFLIIAAIYFRKGGATAFTCLSHFHCYICLLMNRARTRLVKGIEDLLAAAGVQAAGGGGGGQAVRVPVVGELLLQSWGQGVHRANCWLLLHIWVQGGAGIYKVKPIYTQALWVYKNRGMEEGK